MNMIAQEKPTEVAATDGSLKFSRDGKHFVLHARQWLPADRETVWAFVADCRHMNYVIPSFMRFEVLGHRDGQTPPAIAPGVTYEYKLHLHRLGFFWRTLITEVEFPQRFKDEQAKGPYASFSHEHTFEPQDGGTLTTDTIYYRPPGGPLAGVINAAMVRRDLGKLFACRHRRMAELFAGDRGPAAEFFSPNTAAAATA